MLKPYYRVKLAPFLSEQTIETVLSGDNVSMEILKNDIVLSKIDRMSLLSLSFFLNEEPKLINDDSKELDQNIKFVKIKDAVLYDKEDLNMAEAITSLETNINLISLLAQSYNNEMINHSLNDICSEIAKITNTQQLFEFFREYDPSVLKNFIEKARAYPDETEESLKTKMIMSKMKTKITEDNISLTSIVKIENKQFGSIDDLQKLIDYN